MKSALAHRIRFGGKRAAFSCLCALSIGIVATVPAAADSDAESPDQATVEQIQTLVQQLGNDKYVLREQAQEELLQIGPPALDALTAALTNEDVEIVVRARYLLTAIKIEWAKDTDPVRLRETMDRYSSASDAARQAIIGELTTNAGDAEVTVLCRIVRYEKSVVLAKSAAIGIMSADVDERHWAARVKQLETHLDGSLRQGAQWMRIYMQHRGVDDESIALWKRITEAELGLWQADSDRTSYKIVQALLYRLVGLLESANRREEAEPYIQRIVELRPDDVDSVQSLVIWLIDREAPEAVATIAEKYPNVFKSEPFLLYALAHAQRSLGKQKEMEETVQRARNVKMAVGKRITVTDSLRRRGWFEWAEGEYRAMIQANDQANGAAVYSAYRLMEMLHDQHDEAKAAEVAHGLVKSMETNKNAMAWVVELGFQPESIRSRMHYFHAMYDELQGDSGKLREHLELGIKADPNDADILISLYRLPNQTDAQRAETLARINQTVVVYREQIANTPKSPSPYNQFAWLVGNTVGETDAKLGEDAIKYSHTSFEMRPSAAYLDTLGRCYYARSDFENAVKYQTRAVQRDPHSGLIRRQLELFQAALDESEKQKSP